ncbi:PA0069 family radical SAM protein [soil metagenome]
MRPPSQNPRGRGASENVPNRFETLHAEIDLDAEEAAYADDPRPLPTQILRDDSRSIISTNQSPDLSFDQSINPYRGCEHGCAYCYARPYHEFLGFSAGLDFESKIVAKPDAPRLLREALSKPGYVPNKLAMSGVTDCYQPAEKSLRITRGCLEVLAEFRHPVAVITKNSLITRDADLLAELARYQAGAALLSITTLDATLARKLEPRAASPRARLETVATLAAAGIPVGVSIAPVIPCLTDHEIPAILQAAATAGATFATYGIIKLPYGVKDIFKDWLARHVSAEKAQAVLSRIGSLRGGEGRLHDSTFGQRFKGVGPHAEQIARLFRITARRHGFERIRPDLTADHFRPVQGFLF